MFEHLAACMSWAKGQPDSKPMLSHGLQDMLLLQQTLAICATPCKSGTSTPSSALGNLTSESSFQQRGRLWPWFRRPVMQFSILGKEFGNTSDFAKRLTTHTAFAAKPVRKASWVPRNMIKTLWPRRDGGTETRALPQPALAHPWKETQQLTVLGLKVRDEPGPTCSR